MTKNVLVVAAHPDDEALGCGGTIAKHVANGDQVHVVFMADGVGSRGGKFTADLKKRQEAMHSAAEILGISSVACLGLPDNRMDGVVFLDIVQPLEKFIEKLQPEIVYTHHSCDLNIDHRLTNQAVMTACRPLAWSSVKKILSFEVLSSTEWNSPSGNVFVPQYIVDISHVWELKLSALKCYSEEMRVAPHSRSFECVEALATLRGNTFGYVKAEAFFVERILNDEISQ